MSTLSSEDPVMTDNGLDPEAATKDPTATRRLSRVGVYQLFAECDLNGSGFIEHEELRAICNELTSEELSEVFKELDSDQDGKISLEEFADGFQVDY